MTHNLLTKQKLNAQATKETTNVTLRITASIITALSGAILYLDKAFTFNLSNTYGFADAQTFVWVFTQSVSPLILILGASLRPFKISYTVPVYLYTIQLLWVFNPNLKLDDSLLHVYAVGSTLVFIVLMVFLNVVLTRFKSAQSKKITFLEQALDLSLTINKKYRNNA